MVRATHGVHTGSNYFEVEILKPSETGFVNVDDSGEPLPTPHVRIGWSTRQGELQAPVGFDSHSYGYRDEAGKKDGQALSALHSPSLLTIQVPRFTRASELTTTEIPMLPGML